MYMYGVGATCAQSPAGLWHLSLCVMPVSSFHAIFDSPGWQAMLPPSGGHTKRDSRLSGRSHLAMAVRVI